MTDKVIFLTTTGAGTWSVPPDFGAINTIELIGGGQGANLDYGSGDGGDYAKITNLALTPGGSASYSVGAGGAGVSTSGPARNNGGDTWFNGSSFGAASVGAKGGGSSSTSFGATTYAGGVGQGKAATGTNNSYGGAGGAGGPHGAGADGGAGVANSVSGGGGGGGGGGSAGGPTGTNPPSIDQPGGAGGNNYLGAGGGAAGGHPGNPGSAGGGGGGANSSPTFVTQGHGGAGGAGTEWTATAGGTAGSGGGGGSAGLAHSGSTQNTDGGPGGLYGGGGGSVAPRTGGPATSGSGAQGIIVITYTPNSFLPGEAEMVWSGFAPTLVNTPEDIYSPGEATMAWGGFPPTFVSPNLYAPGPAQMRWGGFPAALINNTGPAFNWRATVISQYQTSPIILALVENIYEWVEPNADFDAFFTLMWNVNTAVGYGLDVWGRIVGVGRILHVSVGTESFGWEEGGTTDYTGFGQAPFFGGGAVTSNFALNDQNYRRLILAKAAANITDGSIPAINHILQALFPGRGNCYVTDGGEDSMTAMTMTYTFEFDLTPVEQAIVGQSGALPKPAGVSVTVVTPP